MCAAERDDEYNYYYYNVIGRGKYLMIRPGRALWAGIGVLVLIGTVIVVVGISLEKTVGGRIAVILKKK